MKTRALIITAAFFTSAFSVSAQETPATIKKTATVTGEASVEADARPAVNAVRNRSSEAVAETRTRAEAGAQRARNTGEAAVEGTRSAVRNTSVESNSNVGITTDLSRGNRAITSDVSTSKTVKLNNRTVNVNAVKNTNISSTGRLIRTPVKTVVKSSLGGNLGLR